MISRVRLPDPQGAVSASPAIGGFLTSEQGAAVDYPKLCLTWEAGEMPRIHQHTLFPTGPLNRYPEKCLGFTGSGDQEETVGSSPTFSHVAASSGRLSAATWRLPLADWEELAARTSSTDHGGWVCQASVWRKRAEAPVNTLYRCGSCRHWFSACSQE